MNQLSNIRDVKGEDISQSNDKNLGAKKDNSRHMNNRLLPQFCGT